MIARLKNELTIQTLGEETLIYDSATQRAVCLGPVGSKVLQACMSQTTLAELHQQLRDAGVEDPEAATEEALSQMAGEGLLLDNPPAKTFDRRRFLQAAGVAAALPVVMAVAAPRPAQAVSCNNCDTLGFFGPPANCNNCGDNCLAGAGCDSGSRCCFEYRLANLTETGLCSPAELLGAFGCRSLAGRIYDFDCATARTAAVATGVAQQLYYCCCCAGAAPNSCC